jgi:hypothetical protein
MWESGPAISDYLSWLIDGRGASHPHADKSAGKLRERMKLRGSAKPAQSYRKSVRLRPAVNA